MADVSPSSFTAWARPMENIQDVSPSSSPAFVGKVWPIINFMVLVLLSRVIRSSSGFGIPNRIFQRLMFYLSFLKSSISSSSSCEERRLPLYLLSVKGTKVSVSSPSSLFSLNTILLSCVAVSTGPEDANENTSGFLVGAGWSSTSQSKVTNSQLADFVVQAPLTHSSSASNPLSSSHEDLSASIYWEI